MVAMVDELRAAWTPTMVAAGEVAALTAPVSAQRVGVAERCAVELLVYAMEQSEDDVLTSELAGHALRLDEVMRSQ